MAAKDPGRISDREALPGMPMGMQKAGRIFSNGSIGADASAAAFGKTACADFASARYKNGSGTGRSTEKSGGAD